MSPFFSPDGRWIGFTTFDGQLKKVPVDGGGAVTLTGDANGLFAAGTWLDDETIVYLSLGGVRAVPAVGGTSRTLVPAGESVTLAVAPLPDARGLLVTVCSGNCSVDSDVVLYDMRTDSARPLLSGAAGAWYAPTGQLLFTEREGGLMAVDFDLDELTVTGGRVPVIPDVLPGMFAMSPTGTILYSVPGRSGAATELVWVARDGRTAFVDSTWEGDFVYPAIAPDGQTIAVSRRQATTQLWIRRPDGTRDQLTQEGSVNWRPAWTSDGSAVIYSSRRSDADSGFHYDLYRQVIDHSAPRELLVRHRFSAWEGEVTPDGRWLVFRVDEPGGESAIMSRRLDGTDTAVVRLREGYNLTLSPDGRWLAFGSLATGREEVYVAPFPDLTFTRLVSQGGGQSPRWARNGRELFFKSGGRLMAVPVTPGPGFVTGAPQTLFPVAGYRSAANRPQYDVAQDGQRFLMIRERVAGADQTVYVENWFPELRERLRQ